jgi:hypothetical protein
MVADIAATLLEANNLVLLAILFALFIVGYKLMQAVMDLFLIAIFSGLFFFGLGYVGIGPEFTVTRFILFMALGVGSYMAYTTLSTAKQAVEILWKILTFLAGLLKDIAGTVRDMVGSVIGMAGGDSTTPATSGSTSSGDDGSSGSKEKMAILQEVDDDE